MPGAHMAIPGLRIDKETRRESRCTDMFLIILFFL